MGQEAAAAILALRAHDGSHHAEARVGIDYIPGIEPGDWRQDPVSLIPLTLGAHWGTVTPFVLRSVDQFRAPPPPSLGSSEYAAAFNEVARLGGETATQRTAEQTEIGIYWAYDDTPSPSGYAGFGGALFEILRKFLGTDAVPFTFVSDEFNGTTLGNDGFARPLRPRSFASLSQAEEENGQSRIYLGIHWAFDKTEGIAQGRRVGGYVFDNALVPLHGH